MNVAENEAVNTTGIDDSQVSIVVVVGAGASAEYGFPIGTALRQGIIEKKVPDLGTYLHSLNRTDEAKRSVSLNNNKFIQAQRSNGDQKINRFIADLGAAPFDSIDSFLAVRKESYGSIGLLAISQYLFPYEENAMQRQDLRTGSYRHIVDEIVRVGYDVFLKKARIINFNYDRVLETTIANAIHAMDPNTAAESVMNALEKIMIHPYGRLSLPLEFSQTRGRFVYRDRESYSQNTQSMNEMICLCASELCVIDRDVSQKCVNQFELCRKWMSLAARIYFLGFGFDTQNMVHLGFSSTNSIYLKNSAQVYATTYRMTSAQVERVRQMICNGPNSLVAFQSLDCTCEQFLARVGLNM